MSRRFLWALVAIAFVALGVRVAFAASEGARSSTIGDAAFYFHTANQLAEGDGYTRPNELINEHRSVPTAEHPPLFSYVLAIPAALGARSIFSLEVAGSVIGALGVFAIGLLGRRVGGDAVGLVAAGIAALYPMLFQPAALLFSEPLYVLLGTLILLLAYDLFEPGPQWRWWALGALIGLASLARTEGLLLVPFLAVPLAWRLPAATRTRVLAFLAIAIAAFVVVVPWTIRNAVEFHAFVPISDNSSTALTGANCDSTYSGRNIGAWDYYCTLDAAAKSPEGTRIDAQHDEVERFNQWQARATTYLRDHADRLPVVIPARVLRTWGLWNPTAMLDYDQRDAGVRGWQAVGIAMFWIMLPLAVCGVVVLRRRQVRVWPLMVPVGIVTLMSIVFHGSTRFRAGAEGSVVVLAAVGAVALVEALRLHRSARSADTGVL